MSPSALIPTVDFCDPSQRRDILARNIVEALENVGFLYLENVAGFDSEEIEKAVKWFYSLPSVKKHSVACKRINPVNNNIYRGYFAAQSNDADYLEAYEIGEDLSPESIAQLEFPLYESNQWPSGGEEAKWFRDVVSRYYKTMHITSLRFSSLIARGLGANENWFNSMFSHFPLSSLRLANYPPRPRPYPAASLDGDCVVQCKAHTDTPFVTLLATFDYHGLQIEGNDGKWINVPPRRNSLVVNIGDLLSRTTNYKLKATNHRVVDMGKRRQSAAFFLEPRFDVNINRVIASPGFRHEDEAGEVSYGPWLIQNFKKKEYSEYAGFDFV